MFAGGGLGFLGFCPCDFGRNFATFCPSAVASDVATAGRLAPLIACPLWAVGVLADVWGLCSWVANAQPLLFLAWLGRVVRRWFLRNLARVAGLYVPVNLLYNIFTLLLTAKNGV
jgi:hypothetical protein